MSLQDDFMTTLAAMLREKGVSQAELSRRSGVSIPTISKILNRKMEPSLTTCEKLINAMSAELEISFSFSSRKSA